jgi:thiamine-phosphate pyrophosphorylase
MKIDVDRLRSSADVPMMAEAIVHAHSTLALPQVASEPWPERQSSPVYRAVLQACRALGFIVSDADCLAHAWQRQAERTGCFDPLDWPAHPEDFGLPPWPRTKAFSPCPQQLGLYAVLPDAEWVGRMARAGVPTVQLRCKSHDAAQVEDEVFATVEAVQGTGARLFINDHWDIAIRAGAYGVHLGQEDMDEADLSAIRAAGLRLGLSTHGYAEMVRADACSPSYMALGAVFPTTLKKMATAPQGVGRLQRYARLMRHYPLVAIGGIDAGSIPAVLAAGVGSVAVVRALVGAEQPEQAAQVLMGIVGGS